LAHVFPRPQVFNLAKKDLQFVDLQVRTPCKFAYRIEKVQTTRSERILASYYLLFFRGYSEVFGLHAIKNHCRAEGEHFSPDIPFNRTLPVTLPGLGLAVCSDVVAGAAPEKVDA
jgi:hypothetical protein